MARKRIFGDPDAAEEDARFVFDIKTNILAIAEEKGLYISRVLDQAGVNRSYLANIIDGTAHSPGVTALRRIAVALDEPIEVLLAPPAKRAALSRFLRGADVLSEEHRALYVALALALKPEEVMDRAVAGPASRER